MVIKIEVTLQNIWKDPPFMEIAMATRISPPVKAKNGIKFFFILYPPNCSNE